MKSLALVLIMKLSSLALKAKCLALVFGLAYSLALEFQGQ